MLMRWVYSMPRAPPSIPIRRAEIRYRGPDTDPDDLIPF